jgi:hypothetical protein
VFYNDNAGGGLMKKVKIENSVTGMKYGAVLENGEVDAWVAKCTASGCWGTTGDYIVTIIDLKEDPEYIADKAEQDAYKAAKTGLKAAIDGWGALTNNQKLDATKDAIKVIIDLLKYQIREAK